MTIKSTDRYGVFRCYDEDRVKTGILWTVWDMDGDYVYGYFCTEARAEHVAHCLNAVHAMIASVEALP